MGSSGTVPYGLVTDGSAGQVAAFESLPIDSLWVGGHVASPGPTPEAMVLLAPVGPGPVGCRADETIGLLRQLWTAEPTSHHRRHFHFDDVRIHPAPAQSGDRPIIMAGRQPAAMRRAAPLGDGWMPYLYSPERYERSVTEIRAVADATGGDLTDFEWTAFVFVNVESDGAMHELLTRFPLVVSSSAGSWAIRHRKASSCAARAWTGALFRACCSATSLGIVPARPI